jgi:hypothetical protein
MSMPLFPKVNPDITCENAINMILTSIAMEELALSHIMNAEGEKLQYVLKYLESSCSESGNEYAFDKLLAVNASISDLLDSVSQNQMLLKSKMNKALNALSNTCQEHNRTCASKCSAIFDVKCQKWCHDTSLRWNTVHQHGDCIRVSSDPYKIEINKKGRFLISFSVTVKSTANCKSEIAVSLQTADKKEMYTAYDSAPKPDSMHTISIGGILADTLEQALPFPVFLKLVSAEQVMAEHGFLSIVEI